MTHGGFAERAVGELQSLSADGKRVGGWVGGSVEKRSPVKERAGGHPHFHPGVLEAECVRMVEQGVERAAEDHSGGKAESLRLADITALAEVFHHPTCAGNYI